MPKPHDARPSQQERETQVYYHVAITNGVNQYGKEIQKQRQDRQCSSHAGSSSEWEAERIVWLPTGNQIPFELYHVNI